MLFPPLNIWQALTDIHWSLLRYKIHSIHAQTANLNPGTTALQWIETCIASPPVSLYVSFASTSYRQREYLSFSLTIRSASIPFSADRSLLYHLSLLVCPFSQSSIRWALAGSILTMSVINQYSHSCSSLIFIFNLEQILLNIPINSHLLNSASLSCNSTTCKFT